jgi:hypothetical protein
MTLLTGELTKVPTAVLDISVDVSALLGVSTIASISVSSAGVTVASSSYLGATVSARISGGAADTITSIAFQVTRADGLVFTRYVAVKVVARLVVATTQKAPNDIIQLPATDWSEVLGSDTIASRSWSGGGLTIASGGTTATPTLSGGVAGQDYDATETITTAGGQTDARVHVIQVRTL